MKRKNSYDKSVYRSLALISQFSINMLVPICLMTALGIFLDKKLETSYWVVVLFFVGAIAGGQNVYRMAKNIYSRPRTGKSGNKQDSADGRDVKEDK
jgi:F0F1-type ATP synthase assembly protein I